MSLRNLICGLGHRIDYFPRLSNKLDGDPSTAIVLQQLLYWSDEDSKRNFKADDEGWVDVRAADAENDLGMSPKILRRCKKSLEVLGIIQTRQAGMPKRSQARVITTALEQWWIGVNDEVGTGMHSRAQRSPLVVPKGHHLSLPKVTTAPSSINTKQEEQASKSEVLSFGLSEASEPETSFEKILAGVHDGTELERLLACPPCLMEPLLARWASMWGKSGARVGLTERRRKAWRQALREGSSPSTFAKALVGMKFDDWPERPRHCDWHLISRDVFRWIELYDENDGRTVPANDEAGTKTVKGVRVPHGYVWNHHDDHCRDQGHSFDLKLGRWVK